MAGQLFTSYFLTEGIRTTPEWEAQMSPEADLGVQLRQVHEGFRKYNQPNEAVTEDDLIIPVTQQTRSSNHQAKGNPRFVK